MKLIYNAELKELLAAYKYQRVLINAGVFTWDGYDDAMDEYYSWEKENLDNILDSYPDYRPKEIEDYNYD